METSFELKAPIKSGVPIYTIQKWLFDTAEGRFDVDLAESGIQFHYLSDLKLDRNYDLNYGSDRGLLELRELIAEQYGVSARNVVVTHGTQEALFLFYHSVLHEGEHVICFSPGWQQFWEIPRTLGAEVSMIKLSAANDFQIDWNLVEKAIRPNTKLLIVNSPNNPSAQMFTEDDWATIRFLAQKYHLRVVNDEEYETDFSRSVYHRMPGATSTSSLSKIYGFPGLRIGWAVSTPDLIEKMVNVKRYTTICNSILCEHLGVQVLRNKSKYLRKYTSICAQGIQTLRRFVDQHQELRLIEPQQTPFAAIALENGVPANLFCEQLLERKRVLLMPAEVFESTGFFRLTYGRQDSVLNEGFTRISEFIEE